MYGFPLIYVPFYPTMSLTEIFVNYKRFNKVEIRYVLDEPLHTDKTKTKLDQDNSSNSNNYSHE